MENIYKQHINFVKNEFNEMQISFLCGIKQILNK